MSIREFTLLLSSTPSEQIAHSTVDLHLKEIRPCSVDSLDGGATDVPILGPMEIKNYTHTI